MKYIIYYPFFLPFLNVQPYRNLYAQIIGLINFLEYKLRKQYELANQTGVTNYQEIKSIKSHIDSYRE